MGIGEVSKENNEMLSCYACAKFAIKFGKFSNLTKRVEIWHTSSHYGEIGISEVWKENGEMLRCCACAKFPYNLL